MMTSYSRELNTICSNYCRDHSLNRLESSQLLEIAPPLPEDLIKHLDGKMAWGSEQYPIAFGRIIISVDPQEMPAVFIYSRREGKEVFNRAKEVLEQHIERLVVPFDLDCMYGIIGMCYMGFFPDGAKDPEWISLIVGANENLIQHADGWFGYDTLFQSKNHKLTVGDPRNKRFGLFKRIPDEAIEKENAPFDCIHTFLDDGKTQKRNLMDYITMTGEE